MKQKIWMRTVLPVVSNVWRLSDQSLHGLQCLMVVNPISPWSTVFDGCWPSLSMVYSIWCLSTQSLHDLQCLMPVNPISPWSTVFDGCQPSLFSLQCSVVVSFDVCRPNLFGLQTTVLGACGPNLSVVYSAWCMWTQSFHGLHTVLDGCHQHCFHHNHGHRHQGFRQTMSQLQAVLLHQQPVKCDPTFQNGSHWYCLWFFRYLYHSRERNILFEMIQKWSKLVLWSCYYYSL